MRYTLSIFLLLLSAFQFSVAFHAPGERMRRIYLTTNRVEIASEKNHTLPEKYGPFFHDQPIDHFSSNSSTFKHRYWANADHYQQGGPVVLYNAGETPADDRSFYVINSTMADLARRLNGIVVVMEHRFYGKSMPAPDFSAKSLATLTTKQALEDMAHFIQFMKLPNLDIELPPAPETKYIVYGGSYSGNLAAWMRQKYPHLVFAAVPSSAPVQMSYNYYQYFDPIIKYGPKHCIEAIRSAVLYVDHVLFSPFKEQKDALKKRFGAEGLQHDDDFAECKRLEVLPSVLI
ncbi:serine carboxypeptidase S28-domain-containing protein [Blakeslea trispora]|nr:serine carboxypeptidase S28-domain-containing protein [Blakeslea trispora]